jgi:large subunit ribosomal protein L25
MAEISLVAETGRAHGTRSSKRLRTDGKIPAVVYGHGIDPISVSVEARDLRVALNGEAGSRALLQLQIDGQQHLAVARQLQRHPVRHTVTHVDFQVVSRDEVISADIPIVLLGEALAVHRGDGTVGQELQTLAIRAKPADMPPTIEVDISELEIGQTIRVSDVTLPAGVEVDVDLEHAVVIGVPPHSTLGEEAAAEAEAAEGAAAGTEDDTAGAAGGEGAGES